MNARLATHKLGVYLDAKTEQAISLTQLIKEQFPNETVPCTVDLTITLAPAIKIALNDDLLTRDMAVCGSNIRHSIEFVIHQDTALTYTMAPLPIHPKLPQPVIVEKELVVRLIGQNANADITCACHGTDSNIFTFKTMQDHQAAQTTSSLHIKAVLDDESKMTSLNMIHVEKEAQQVKAEQSCKSILLSNQAHAVAVPQLEIKTNNVACKHGAAISSLDQEQLFYLQSRGLNKAQTKEMLIKGFLRKDS